MIYMLGTSYHYENEDLEDIIIMASTNIEDILEHLYNNISYNCFNDYVILTKENGDLDYGYINVFTSSYDNFVKYTPYIFLKEENKNEFEHVKNQLRIWCDAFTEKKKREQEERQLFFATAEEKQERELYEKLKAKYGE